MILNVTATSRFYGLINDNCINNVNDRRYQLNDKLNVVDFSGYSMCGYVNTATSTWGTGGTCACHNVPVFADSTPFSCTAHGRPAAVGCADGGGGLGTCGKRCRHLVAHGCGRGATVTHKR